MYFFSTNRRFNKILIMGKEEKTTTTKPNKPDRTVKHSKDATQRIQREKERVLQTS